MKLNIRASANGAEILIYGPLVDFAIWDVETGAKQIREQISAHKGKEITVRINSPGGDFFAGAAIYSALKDHDAPVTVKIEGLAASAASLVAMAGDPILISPTATIMIHRASMFAAGNNAELEKCIVLLEKIDGIMADAYTAKTGLPRDEIVALMEEETFFTADEAVDRGFASASMDFSTGQDEIIKTVASASIADMLAAMSKEVASIAEQEERALIARQSTEILQKYK